jgi:hypothetical protein
VVTKKKAKAKSTKKKVSSSADKPASAPKQKSIQVTLDKILVDPNSPTKAVTNVFWTRLGNDIQLEFGAVDLAEIRGVMVSPTEGDTPPVIPVKIYDRYIISMSVLGELKKMIDDTLVALRDRPVLGDLALMESDSKDKH